MIEDIPDHRRVLDETDDPHGSLTFRADQRIGFVYLLNQPGPTFPERLFVSLRFEDAGDGIINSFLPNVESTMTLTANGKAHGEACVHADPVQRSVICF